MGASIIYGYGSVEGPGMTYKDTGVNYDAMDPFKKKCQLRAARTSNNALRLGISSVEWSRGESAYLAEVPRSVIYSHIGHVEEGLGSKNLVADAVRPITGNSGYDKVTK